MRRRTSTILPALIASLLAAATTLTSCASAARSRLHSALKRDEPPEDFVLAVTVHPPPRATPGAAAPNTAAAARRGPARFVMEADWILRAYFGPNISEQSFPGQTRQLTHDQVQRLWWELRDSGLVEGAPAFSKVPPAAGGAVISYSIAGVHRMLAPTPADRPPGSRIVDRLAELAWVMP